VSSFHFRLDPLLRPRRFELERARRGLGERLRQLEAARERAEAAARRAGGRAAEQEQRARRGLPAGLLAAERDGLAGVLREAAAAEQAARAAEAPVATQRREVLVRFRAVRSLEKLRERRREEWEAEERRAEQHLLDEVGGQRLLRAARAEGGS